jgi:hypothetical protein
MNTTDKLLRGVLGKAQPVLDRLGIVSAPVRDVFQARRALTFGRPAEEVERFLADASHARSIFATPAIPEPGPASAESATITWRLEGRGRAEARLRPVPLHDGETEVLLLVRLDELPAGTQSRYAGNAGVVASRALHRAKSLLETGEAPTLARNPAARPDPDPFGD